MNTSQQPKSNLTTEQRIYIAAGHDTEKIKMIRELMEEEAVNFAEHIDNNFTRMNPYKTNNLWISKKDIFMDNPIDTKTIYQQTK